MLEAGKSRGLKVREVGGCGGSLVIEGRAVIGRVGRGSRVKLWKDL